VVDQSAGRVGVQVKFDIKPGEELGTFQVVIENGPTTTGFTSRGKAHAWVLKYWGVMLEAANSNNRELEYYREEKAIRIAAQHPIACSSCSGPVALH
jgi:hypothetical protein